MNLEVFFSKEMHPVKYRFRLEVMFLIYVYWDVCARKLAEFLQVADWQGRLQERADSRKGRGTAPHKRVPQVSGVALCQHQQVWQHRDVVSGHSHKAVPHARLASWAFPPQPFQPWRKSTRYHYFYPVKRLNLFSRFVRVKKICHY